MTKFLLLFSFLFLISASSIMAQNAEPSPSPSPLNMLQIDGVAWNDTCALYVNLTESTNDRTGLVLQGRDITDALIFTRCECRVSQATSKEGEVFLMYALYSNLFQVKTETFHQAYRTVWLGNSTKFLLKK